MNELHLFAGAGGASSVESFSDIPAYVLSRLNLTAEKSSCKGNETESCQHSLFGTTLEPSTENRGGDSLRLSVVGSHAKTSAKPMAVMGNQEKGLMEKEADYGWNFQESFGRFSQGLFLSRTAQNSLFGELTVCSVTWPGWGMMLGGECFPLRTLVLATLERGFLSLPTPVKSDAHRMRYKVESFMKIYERRKNEKKKGDGTLGTVLPTFHQKRPSPESVEMMMFFPNGWTGLEPLEIPKFQQWLSSHGKHFQHDKTNAPKT